MNHEDRVYGYRKDNRSDNGFEYYIRKYSVMEEKYLLQFIDVHNKRRKKREVTVEHWGNMGTGEIVKNLNELEDFCRPDFILNRCYDNSYLVKTKQPIEVQTCKSLEPEKCYIKKSKIDWPYDKYTKKICRKKTVILFVKGTSYPRLEKYILLLPNFLEKIKENGIEYPNYMGGKASYFFYLNDVKWKKFNGKSSQQRLDSCSNGGS